MICKIELLVRGNYLYPTRSAILLEFRMSMFIIAEPGYSAGCPDMTVSTACCSPPLGIGLSYPTVQILRKLLARRISTRFYLEIFLSLQWR